MTVSHPELERECRVFSAYLGAASPTAYVVDKYAQAHLRVAALGRRDGFDTLLVALAGRHPALTKIADAYARLFAPAALLRNKLVILFAILETSVPGNRVVFNSQTRSRPAAALGLAAQGCLAVVCALIGVIVFPAIHIAFRLRNRMQ